MSEASERYNKLAWDFCDSEHSWEKPCSRCCGLAAAIEQAVREERDRIHRAYHHHCDPAEKNDDLKNCDCNLAAAIRRQRAGGRPA
jgi:hypothetical protein